MYWQCLVPIVEAFASLWIRNWNRRVHKCSQRYAIALEVHNQNEVSVRTEVSQYVIRRDGQRPFNLRKVVVHFSTPGPVRLLGEPFDLVEELRRHLRRDMSPCISRLNMLSGPFHK